MEREWGGEGRVRARWVQVNIERREMAKERDVEVGAMGEQRRGRKEMHVGPKKEEWKRVRDEE